MSPLEWCLAYVAAGVLVGAVVTYLDPVDAGTAGFVGLLWPFTALLYGTGWAATALARAVRHGKRCRAQRAASCAARGVNDE